jgi:hypothetical protein
MVLLQGEKSMKHGIIADHIMLILLWTSSANCLQHHMTEMAVTEL